MAKRFDTSPEFRGTVPDDVGGTAAEQRCGCECPGYYGQSALIMAAQSRMAGGVSVGKGCGRFEEQGR
jgi:hypothetical protein